MYVGDWHNGSAHGQGAFRYGANVGRRSGERYEGQFQGGAKHGFGTYYYPDGRSFVGQYKVPELTRSKLFGLVPRPNRTDLSYTHSDLLEALK